MPIITKLNAPTHQEVIYAEGQRANLKAIIAIHDTTLGPAIGGTRMCVYDTQHQALADVLRLSSAMTYKAAAARLDFGGGKAVIIGDPQRDKTEELLYEFGRVVDSLGGRFITGEDAGTTSDDMRVVARKTKYAIYPPEHDEADSPTSFVTAFGVFRGIQASVRERWGEDSLSGVRVAIQGVGKVGYQLARLLHAEGAQLTVADPDCSRLMLATDEFDAKAVGVNEVYGVDVDVLSPCAFGGILNDDVIPRLKCQIVAGSANNQLAEERDGDQLWRRNILYAPDYIVNAGGLISALYEMGRCNKVAVMAKTEKIYERLRRIYEISALSQIPTNVAAAKLVEEVMLSSKASLAP